MRLELSRTPFGAAKFDKDEPPLSALAAQCGPRSLRARTRTWATAAPLRNLVTLVAMFAVALSLGSIARAADIDMPAPDIHDALQISADHASRWTEGVYDVWLLSGNCTIDQGGLHAHADQAVLWIEKGDFSGNPPFRTLAYFEGNVSVESRPAGNAPSAPSRMTDQHWYHKFLSSAAPAIRTSPPTPEPMDKSDVYRRAVAARGPVGDPAVKKAQYAGRRRAETVAPGAAVAAPPVAAPPGTRRIRFFPRSDQPLKVNASTTNPATNEQTIVFSSGVNVIVDGLQNNVGSIDVSADRVVIWTTGLQTSNLTGETVQADEMPLEIYMEGNIVFRQGERIVYAPAMYYDVQQNIGVVLQAEMLAPLPNSKIPGKITIRAPIMRQIDEDRFVAQDASVTSSRLGDPTFELRSGTVVYEDKQLPQLNFFTGQPEVDPTTGQPLTQQSEQITASNNRLVFEGVPFFYWPTFSTDLERDDFYITNAEFKTDRVFGNQFLIGFDVYEILGLKKPPPGTYLEMELEEMTRRGFAIGEEFRWDRSDGLFGATRTVADLNSYFVLHDSGIDDLGSDRLDLIPETQFRGRAFGHYRQPVFDGWTFTGQLGYQTDRNFWEEYFNHEFDTLPDLSNYLELRRNYDNAAFTVLATGRFNDVYTETEWLPRLDHFWLGQPLIDDSLTLYEHTNVAYAEQDVAATPTDPTDAAKFTKLPWESPDLHGQRLATRDELDYPFQLGPFKVVPYALGELANWGEDLDHQEFSRAYGMVGIRASIPIWAVDPTIQDDLFNIHGIAHKIDLSIDANMSQATDNLANLPLYDQLQDESVQHFERRFEFNTFGINGMPELPLRFDPRYYALRRGSEEWVTGPTEIAGDQAVIRLDADQRWQTKRGPIGDQHILDYITLDTSAEIFPDPKQNFGSVLGLVQYDFHWFVGDRLTIVSDAMADFFGDGQKEASIGMFLARPPRGSFYTGFYSLSGPIHAEVIATSYTYRMTDKWASTFATSFNVSPSLDIGQSFSITRIGESFLVTLGLSYDDSRHVFGANLMIEPRALGRSLLAKTRGLDIPPAGANGLE